MTGEFLFPGAYHHGRKLMSEITVFTYLLLILVTIVLFSSSVEIFFSPEEMNDMGIRLEHQDGLEQIADF